MKRTILFAVIIFATSIFLTSCAGLMPKKEKIIIPIHKVWDDNENYYSFGIGQSKDLQFALDKATMDARARLANYLKTQVLLVAQITDQRFVEDDNGNYIASVVIKAPKNLNPSNTGK